MRLGPLEADLLRFLWASEHALTATDLHAELSTTRPIAYTTVLSSLQRMARKGLVAQDRREKAHRFTPLVRQEDMFRDLMEEALGLTARNQASLTRFLGELDGTSLDRLREALDEVDES